MATPESMLRIVTTGIHDTERLNAIKGRPTINFYRSVFKVRTRWASQWRRVEFDNLADFGKRATVTLPQLGELITRAILVVELPDIFTPQSDNRIFAPIWSWTNSIGHALCSDVDLRIGEQIVDSFDSRLLEVLDEHSERVEHFDTTNSIILRDPSTYTQNSSRQGVPRKLRQNVDTAPKPQSVEMIFPFWWNRGPGPQPLPIQALAKDKVQINVTFRPIQECVYTDARTNPLNPGPEANEAGPLPTMAGSSFYQKNTRSTTKLYDMTNIPVTVGAGDPTYEPSGNVISGLKMPTEWHFRDAYWLIEYVSLEDREAAAFRLADLQIPIEKHVAIPVVSTNGASTVRIPINQGGLVRELLWVAQRAEATDYNAYFLFSRDLAPSTIVNHSQIPWWPDAKIPDWDYGDGYIRPAFADRQSDPIVSATFWTRGIRRFELDGPSIFRSLIPSLNCGRAPLVDRYIYRYDFGFWPTGSLNDTIRRPLDEVRGFSNWDKLPNKELELQMNVDRPSVLKTEADTSQIARKYDSSGCRIVAADNLRPVDGSGNDISGTVVVDFRSSTDLFEVSLQAGALVRGVVDYQRIRKLPGFKRLLVRIVPEGSCSLVAQTATGFVWIAVAGANSPDLSGGFAGDAVSIGTRGDGATSHSVSGTGYGGAGGGRNSDAAIGRPDGIQMSDTDGGFVYGLTSTGGATRPRQGGDGYYGGGSGTNLGGGGGGGSYVSPYITKVYTVATPGPQTQSVTLTPLRRVIPKSPPFNIYAWITTYNILHITGGRGALLFGS